MKQFKLKRLRISANAFRFYAVVSIYAFVCVLYIAIVPLAAEYFETIEIVWPYRRGALVYDLILVSLATIMPIIIGVLKLSIIREERGSVSVQYCVKALATAFFLSLAINTAFVIEMRVEFFLDMFDKADSKFFGFLGLPEFFYVLSHSAIPPAAIFLHFLVNSNNKFGILSACVAVAVITTGHFVAYAIYELVAGVQWHYYWHQGILAFVFSVASFGGLNFYIYGTDLEA